MILPTEPIGSIPRPPALIAALAASRGVSHDLSALYDEAIRDTIAEFEATGSPSRGTAFANIKARVVGTTLASQVLGGSGWAPMDPKTN